MGAHTAAETRTHPKASCPIPDQPPAPGAVDTRPGEPPPSGAPLMSPMPQVLRTVDPELLWQALVEDSEARVGLTTLEGEVLWANDIARQRHAARLPRPLDGMNMYDLVPQPIAEEFRRAKEQCLSTGHPVTIETVIDGVQTHLTYRVVARGERPVFLVVARDAVQPLADHSDHPEHPYRTTSTRDLGRLSVLTRRELEILALIGEHLTSQQIADRLHRSVKTIEWHRVSIGRKLKVRSRTELAFLARRAGLTSPSEHFPPTGSTD